MSWGAAEAGKDEDRVDTASEKRRYCGQGCGRTGKGEAGNGKGEVCEGKAEAGGGKGEAGGGIAVAGAR